MQALIKIKSFISFCSTMFILSNRIIMELITFQTAEKVII